MMVILRVDILVIVVMVTFGGDAIAQEPKGCKIYHLNGTALGESWTSSVPIKSGVTLALRNPNPEPWSEIDVEFESNRGASVGTLKVTRSDSSVDLSLSRWATTVHTDLEKTQVLQAQGSLMNLHNLQDWVYVNVTAARRARVAIDGSSTFFGAVHAKPFKTLYVRVPDGQDLDVGFNCISATQQVEVATPIPEGPENSGMVITSVAIILVLVVVGVCIYWFLGRKRRNALVEKFKEDEKRCHDCGDSISDDDDEGTPNVKENITQRDEEKAMLNDDDRCDECGDEIVEESDEKTKPIDPESDVEKGTLTQVDIEKETITPDIKMDGTDVMDQPTEDECSCSDEEHKD